MYEITELAMPGNTVGSKLFLQWQPGHDFPVRAHAPVNPHGRNGRVIEEEKNEIPSSKSGRNVIKVRTKTACFWPLPVIIFVTSLIYHHRQRSGACFPAAFTCSGDCIGDCISQPPLPHRGTQ